MGAGYDLVNQTRREVVMYSHLGASKATELAGNPAAAAVTVWYMLQCRGDRIAFVSDTNGEWPFPSGRREDIHEYEEVTDRIVSELIDVGILRDDGVAWSDPAEPETNYYRALANIFWREADSA